MIGLSCNPSLVSRYGGISVGGQLPVLDVQPKTIQDVASQLGRLLNVTGVRFGVCVSVSVCVCACVWVRVLVRSSKLSLSLVVLPICDAG